MKREHTLQLLAMLAGAAVWIAIAWASGRREAWDSGLYLALGLPLVCLLALVLAYRHPERPWRWGVLPVAGQFAALLVLQGPGNLLPLGIAAFAVLSIPSVVAARIGAAMAKRAGTRSDG